MARPGIILYFEILESLRAMSLDDVGRLIIAMLEYGKSGKLPEFDGILAIVWGFVKPKLDRDDEEYERTVLKRQYASFCRERKKKNEPEISFDEWMKSFCIGDHQSTSMISHDTICNHMISHDINYNYNYNRNPNPNKNYNDNYSCSCNDNDNNEDGGDSIESKVYVFGGNLGKGVVFMSDEQREDLLDRMGIDTFDYYVDKLSRFIIDNGARVKNHYETLLKWWKEDSIVRSPRKKEEIPKGGAASGKLGQAELAAIQRVLAEE